MRMCAKDIAREFRLAKNQGEQIKILADLNCCSKDDIVIVLESEGEDVTPFKRKPKNITKTFFDDLEEETSKFPFLEKAEKKTPDVIIKHIEVLVKEKETEIEELSNKLVSLSNEVEELRGWLKGVSNE